jgi:quinol monooxygenase YgiN
MLNKSRIIFIVITLFVMIQGNSSFAQDKNLVVRIARLVIDSAQLEAYQSALKEHAAIAVKVEPGVLNLYAVYEKNHPTHVTVFEIYANVEAYKAHLLTPHFLKYNLTTKDMVKSLELVETVPIALETKFRQ